MQEQKIIKTGVTVAVAWSLLLFFSLYISIQADYQVAERQAEIAARADLNRDQAIRLWMSKYGGLYARVSENLQPSPHLLHLPMRDIQTEMGEMTLLNPAFMLRSIMEEYGALYGIKSRIVGLKALRPENTADDWEKQVIDRFRADKRLEEYSEIVESNGESFLRMMVPMYMKAGCEKCHAVLGYREGDLRGGVNVSVPMETYYAVAKSDSIISVASHGGIWLIGLFGIGLVTTRSNKAAQIRERGIQELRSAEQAWREASNLNEKIFDESPIGLGLYDQNGQCIAINKSAPTIIGGTREQLLAQNFNEIESWKESGLLEVARRSIEQQENLQHEASFVTTFGKHVYINCVFAPFIFHGNQHLLLMIDNISERKATERALRESELWMTNIFNAMDEAVLVVSPERELLNVNNSAVEMFGYSVEEISNNSTELFHVDHEHYVEFGGWIQQAFSEGKTARFDFEAKRKNGEVFPTEHTVTQLKDDNGEVKGIVSVVKDITERRKTETELRSYRHQLEELVINRTGELRQSLAEKEVLLKEVHHRVKNNMAMVSAFISLHLNQFDDGPSMGALKACGDRIQAMSMVHKRLYQSSDFTSIGMGILFNEICDALHEKVDSEKIDVEINSHGIHLDMDTAIPCAMIVNELFSNSLKHAFVEQDSGKVSICMDAVNNENYFLCYSDNGGGFPVGMNINDVDSLGLQLVSVFIDQLKGSVKFDSKDGVNFEIVFPKKGVS